MSHSWKSKEDVVYRVVWVHSKRWLEVHGAQRWKQIDSKTVHVYIVDDAMPTCNELFEPTPEVIRDMVTRKAAQAVLDCGAVS